VLTPGLFDATGHGGPRFFSFSPRFLHFRVLAFETQKGRAAAANPGTTPCRAELFAGLQRSRSMKKPYHRHRSCAARPLPRTPALLRRPAWRSPERTNGAKARWFDGHHRHERNQGQYQKGQGRCTGPEGREEVSRFAKRGPSASSYVSMRTSMHQGVKLHRFAGILPEQFFDRGCPPLRCGGGRPRCT